MAPKLLITGATGLVGFAVLHQALKAGYSVRFTARSEEKTKVVLANPVIEKLAPGDKLEPIIVPDITADGAFDAALQGITHVIHVGSPLPKPGFDPAKEVYVPTIRSLETMFEGAMHTPSVKRVVVTSSIMGYFDHPPDVSQTVTAATRLPLPDPLPTEFSDGGFAYALAKRLSLHAADDWVAKHKPHFSVHHLPLGWVVGRDELCRSASELKDQFGSNGFIARGFTGAEPPIPLGNAASDLRDVAEIHLRTALDELPADAPSDFGISVLNPEWENTFAYAAKAYPKAAAAGVLQPGKIQGMPIAFSSADTERVFGVKFHGYEDMVVELAGQYLDLLGHERA